MTEKAQELKEDARTYKEKLQAKRRNEEEDWDDLDLDELDADEAAVEKAAVAEEAPAEEAPVAEAAADVTAAAAEEVTSEEDLTEEEVDPVMENTQRMWKPFWIPYSSRWNRSTNAKIS